jgi:stalled ribosome alternative rescue factor ArfA
MKTRTHYALFNKDLPFKAKVEKDKTKYTRKAKHKGNRNDS